MKWTFASGLRDPDAYRSSLLALPIAYRSEPPRRGAHLYVHLTAICDVACHHCMYSSDRSAPDGASKRLDLGEIDRTLYFIEDSRPAKVTISGGGEPFLEFRNLLRLVESAKCDYLELITSARWARKPQSASRILEKIWDAVGSNPACPKVMLRASIDDFHLTAPTPVPLDAYSNLVCAWLNYRDRINLGFRSLLVDGDSSVNLLAEKLGAQVQEVNSWNKRIHLANGVSVPVTYNVLRFIGKGTQLREKFSGVTSSVNEYFAPFEVAPTKLILSRAVNDAINASYFPHEGISITINYDGFFYIFTATSPDRRCHIRAHNFETSLEWFYSDPLTRVLLAEGSYWLCDAIRPVAPAFVAEALMSNDISTLVERLLGNSCIRAFATIAALKHLFSVGEAWSTKDDPLVEYIRNTNMSLIQQATIEALVSWQR
jgi:hypothetical protein